MIFTTFMVVYLFRRRVLVRLIMSCFWLLLGIINGVILANRVTPFTGPDLRNLSDGAKVCLLYTSHRIPAYTCDDCGEITVVRGGMPEKCPNCGSTHITQDPDTLDTWLRWVLPHFGHFSGIPPLTTVISPPSSQV